MNLVVYILHFIWVEKCNDHNKNKWRKILQVTFSHRTGNEMELKFLEKLFKRDFLIWGWHPSCFLQLVPNSKSSSNYLASLKLETMVIREIEGLQVFQVFGDHHTSPELATSVILLYMKYTTYLSNWSLHQFTALLLLECNSQVINLFSLCIWNCFVFTYFFLFFNIQILSPH